MTYGQNSSFTTWIQELHIGAETLAHADPGHCINTKPSLEIRNGVSLIFGLLIFKSLFISLFLLFLWTVNGCFAELFLDPL